MILILPRQISHDLTTRKIPDLPGEDDATVYHLAQSGETLRADLPVIYTLIDEGAVFLYTLFE